MKRNLIFDLGMHRGEDTDFYLRKGFSVVGVEANPLLVKECEERFHSYIADRKLTIVGKAISGEDGTAVFYLNEQISEWGTIKKTWAERNVQLGTISRSITVETTTLQSLLKEFGVPYYMKIDIEGMDYACLEALSEFTNRPRYISIESSKESFDDLFSEISKLWELGYRRFKAVRQQDVPKQRPPMDAKEGQYVDYHFPSGSSGLFGEELPGSWLLPFDILKFYRHVFRRYSVFGDRGTFRRLSPVSTVMNIDRTSRSELLRRAYRAARWGADIIRLRPGHYDTHAMLGSEH
jgi:FkbM family methyltransferase